MSDSAPPGDAHLQPASGRLPAHVYLAVFVLIGLVAWSVHLAVAVSGLRGELETRVGWLVSLERARTEHAEVDLAELARGIEATAAVSAETLEAARKVPGAAEDERAAALHGAVVAIRAETRALSQRLGDRWDALYLLVAALAGLAGLVCVLLMLRVRHVRGLARALATASRAERALGEKAGELARSNQELSQFASVISHDLRTPLQTVLGFAALLRSTQSEALDARSLRQLEVIEDGAMRMRAQLDALLQYARVGGGGAPVVVDTGAALVSAVANLHGALEESGGVIEHDELPAALGHPHLMVQVFQNLLSNSLKFRGPAPPRVEISAALDGAHWRFAVRDNGVGIPATDLTRIFDVFARADATRDVPGTGVGLSIVKKIVEGDGGRVWAETLPEGGAAVYFTLPAPPAEA